MCVFTHYFIIICYITASSACEGGHHVVEFVRGNISIHSIGNACSQCWRDGANVGEDDNAIDVEQVKYLVDNFHDYAWKADVECGCEESHEGVSANWIHAGLVHFYSVGCVEVEELSWGSGGRRELSLVLSWSVPEVTSEIGTEVHAADCWDGRW